MKPSLALTKDEYEVRRISLAACQDLVANHHYSKGGANTATYRHGLFHVDQPSRILGCAWWIPPTRSAATATWDGDWREVLSLSRLVVLPEVPTNGCSFLIAHSIRLIRADGRFRCLVTYADHAQGHTGAIYRATNWEYLGETAPEPTWCDTDGRMTARKAGPKTRTRSEMQNLGMSILANTTKSKFRMILPMPARRLMQTALLVESEPLAPQSPETVGQSGR